MTETAKFYTKARRIPMLVGKLPSGGRIWGGPYTITQVGAGAVMAFALWRTAPLWAQLGGFMNIVVAVGLVVAVVWATGKLPSSGRNPISLVMDAMNLTSSPGRLVGGQVTLPKPRLVTHRVMVVLPRPSTGPAQQAEPAVRRVEAPGPVVTRPVPTELLPELTGRGPADATFEGRQLEPRPDPQPRPVPDKRPPTDWAAAAAKVAATGTAAPAADRKSADLTGVGQLFAAQPQNTDRTAPTTPRKD